MKASAYRQILRGAYESGREAIPFETCVELAVAGGIWPEFERSRKWQAEWEYVCNRFGLVPGGRADMRFAAAWRREVQAALAAKGRGEVPPWAEELAEKRYRVQLKGFEVEKLKGPEPSTSQPFNLSTGASREISRFEGGVALRTGKDRPEGRGANCNGFATAKRGRCGDGAKGNADGPAAARNGKIKSEAEG